jgi:hypothetical protein
MMGGLKLVNTRVGKDLGVLISDDLEWTSQVNKKSKTWTNQKCLSIYGII